MPLDKAKFPDGVFESLSNFPRLLWSISSKCEEGGRDLSPQEMHAQISRLIIPLEEEYAKLESFLLRAD